MKGICIGYKGTEEIINQEIKEITGKDSVIEDSCAIFETDDEKDFAKLCYVGQSFTAVLQLLDKFELNELNDLKTDIDFSFLKGRKFKVECTRTGVHDFGSMEAVEKLAEQIHAKDSLVDLKNPDIIIHVFIINNKCIIGIDYAGIDLSKRDYKVYLQQESMKGAVAYFMIRYSGYTADKKLLDPFCGSGTIPIEAALFATGFPINKFRKNKLIFLKMGVMGAEELEKLDKKKDFKGKIFGSDKEFGYVENAKKNAKIAGINKEIEFARNDVEWLDVKFKQGEIDFIVTDIPKQSKRMDEKKIMKVYGDFFDRAKFMLSKNGKICVLGNGLAKDIAKENGFKLEKETVIEKNNNELEVLVFKR